MVLDAVPLAQPRLGTYRGPFHTWFAQETWTQLAGWLSADAPVAWGKVGAGVAVRRVLGRHGPPQPVDRLAVAPRRLRALDDLLHVAHVVPDVPRVDAEVRDSALRGHLGSAGAAIVAYGLILGDVGTGALWILYAMIRHVPAYAFWQ